MTTEKEFWEFASRYFRTLTSIQNIIDELKVSGGLSKDVRAIKAMKGVENVMKEFDEQNQKQSSIDEDCVGCAGPCNVVDVAANLQKELDEAHGILASKDRVLVNLHKTIHDFKAIETQETDRLHKIIEELKDRNIEDMHELYDLYEDELRGIKADRTSIKSDRDIMFQNYRNTVAKLQADIKGLEVELSDLTKYKRYSDLRKRADDKTIECLEAELSAHKEDSKVLMKVVEIVKEWQNLSAMVSTYDMRHLRDLVKDYLDAPEGPPETPIDDLYKVTVTYAFLEMP